MIAWEYLNKVSATVNAVKDYEKMKDVIRITPDEIKEQHERMVRTGGGNLTGVANVPDPHSGETALVNTIHKIDILKERYRQAVEYMSWFDPAWKYLTEKERSVLREFYIEPKEKGGANKKLQDELNYSKATVDRLRRKSLQQLSLLLFGK